MMIRIERRWLLRLFWGKRSYYPPFVVASHRAWWRWFREQWLWK